VIEQVIEMWHRVVAGEFPRELDGLLADDVVFYSLRRRSLDPDTWSAKPSLR
jgi:hypothetical protein